MNEPQIIRTAAGEELVVLSRAEYDALVAAADEATEDEEDIAIYDARKVRTRSWRRDATGGSEFPNVARLQPACSNTQMEEDDATARERPNEYRSGLFVRSGERTAHWIKGDAQGAGKVLRCADLLAG